MRTIPSSQRTIRRKVDARFTVTVLSTGFPHRRTCRKALGGPRSCRSIHGTSDTDRRRPDGVTGQSPAALTASGLPAGATAAFTPSSVTGTAGTTPAGTQYGDGDGNQWIGGSNKDVQPADTGVYPFGSAHVEDDHERVKYDLHGDTGVGGWFHGNCSLLGKNPDWPRSGQVGWNEKWGTSEGCFAFSEQKKGAAESGRRRTGVGAERKAANYCLWSEPSGLDE